MVLTKESVPHRFVSTRNLILYIPGTVNTGTIMSSPFTHKVELSELLSFPNEPPFNVKPVEGVIFHTSLGTTEQVAPTFTYPVVLFVTYI